MKNKRLIILFSLLSSIAVFLDLVDFQSIQNMNYEHFYNKNVLIMGLMSLTLIKLGLANKDRKISKSKTILIWLFSAFMLIGEAYVGKGTLNLIFANVTTIIISVFKIIGYAYIFRLGFIYLDIFLNKIDLKEKASKNRVINWYKKKLDIHPFLTPLVSILLAFSIYIIAFYPIVLSPDPAFQIRQYYNVPTKYINWVIQRDPNVFITAHHPVTQTFLLGWCIDLGRMLINDNFGLFIYTLGQTLIYASILAYTCTFALKKGIAKRYVIMLNIMYLLVPMYAFYSISAVKDTLYTAFMILFVLYIYDFVHTKKDVLISKRSVLILYIVMMLMSLFRHNGAYIIVMTLPFILVYSKVNRKRLLISFGLFAISLFSFNKILVPALGISDGSVREMLSVPFQQTARYVKYHADELSDEDIKTIDYILNYDTLAERYKPEIADPVKNEYNKYTETKDLIAYFKIWFKGLVKHPETYIDATLNNIYGYIYPNDHNWYIYSTYDTRVTKNKLVRYHFNDLVGLRNILTVYGNIFPYLLIIGLLASIGANTWLLLILSAYLITNKKKKYLIALVPLYGSLLFCIISPVNTYFRYTMPYVFILPILTILLLKEVRGVKNEKK
ncbi:MAG: DUF6020 family protein [Bacilli bacterium]|nr:DUF6020 family protein [Bacilli bacterium]